MLERPSRRVGRYNAFKPKMASKYMMNHYLRGDPPSCVNPFGAANCLHGNSQRVPGSLLAPDVPVLLGRGGLDHTDRIRGGERLLAGFVQGPAQQTPLGRFVGFLTRTCRAS